MKSRYDVAPSSWLGVALDEAAEQHAHREHVEAAASRTT